MQYEVLTMKNLQWSQILSLLENGEIRSAETKNGQWKANIEVKSAILDAFKNGRVIDYTNKGYPGFFDKDNLPTQQIDKDRNIRLVPGGSSIRAGSFIAENVIIMPPSYINIGAYIDTGSMVDSHVLVGSCAQIGKNVHLSAGVQIGGVLEPIGLNPVVIEDDAFIGAGSIIVEGIQISKRAIIAPGVILSKSIPVFDCVNDRVLERGEAIPRDAIVVGGTRPINKNLKWGNQEKLQMNCAIIPKYRDATTDSSLELEELLR